MDIWAWTGLVVLINGQEEDRINTVINMSSVCWGARSQISMRREQWSQGTTSYHHLHTYWTSLSRMLMFHPSQLLRMANSAVSGAYSKNNESFLHVYFSNFAGAFYLKRLTVTYKGWYINTICSANLVMTAWEAWM